MKDFFSLNQLEKGYTDLEFGETHRADLRVYRAKSGNDFDNPSFNQQKARSRH